MCFRPLLLCRCFFGMQNLVKFYSQCKTEQEQSQFYLLRYLFLLSSLDFNRDIFFIQVFLLSCRENPIVKDYLWLIPFTGLCMAYFEIFYAWARVNMHSVLEILLK
jgi:hypothetical protein